MCLLFGEYSRKVNYNCQGSQESVSDMSEIQKLSILTPREPCITLNTRHKDKACVTKLLQCPMVLSGISEDQKLLEKLTKRLFPLPHLGKATMRQFLT